MKKKDLILSLIKDDLSAWKLIYAFNALGFEADQYATHAGSTVLKLMRFKVTGLQWESLHDEYLERTKKVEQIDILESPHLLRALVQEIYDFLKKKRQEEKLKKTLQS